jgi:hypothetical protein
VASTARGAEIEAQARKAAERARWSMALSGQAISDAAMERVVAYAIAKRLKTKTGDTAPAITTRVTR